MPILTNAIHWFWVLIIKLLPFPISLISFLNRATIGNYGQSNSGWVDLVFIILL